MIAPFFIIPRIGRLAYLNNPKAACSSVLLALSQMRLDQNFLPPQALLPDGSHPIHGFHPEYVHLEYFFRRWPLDYPPLPRAFIKFSFVRNPYTRFYSFYKSKVLAGQAPGKYYERFGIEKGCSFEKCVQVITSLDPRELEHHAAPQSMLLCSGETLLVDFVGKVENFAHDWQVINDLTGFDLQLEHLNKIKVENAAVYSPEAKERIYNYYRDDFDLFCYDKDSELENDSIKYYFDGSIYSGHHLSIEIIDKLGHDLRAANEKIRQISTEFSRDKFIREEFFGNSEELFRELILKDSFFIDKKVNENNLIQLSIRKNVEKILKFNNSCKNKLSVIDNNIQLLVKAKEDIKWRLKHIQKEFDKEKKDIQKQLNRDKEEIELTRNLLYRNVLSTFRRARRSRWKSLCRRLRSPRLREAKFLRNSGLVDPHYYFENYPHAIKPGLTASEHYVRFGAQDGYNPSAQFNTQQYLAENPDAVNDGINPLVHYILNRQGR
jgi:hypothetical protein